MSTFGVSGKTSYRSNNALGFLLSAAPLAAITVYLAPVADLESCALCSMIRLMLVIMAGLYLVGFVLNFRVLQRLFALLHLGLLGTGIVTIVRHLLAPTDSIPGSCSDNASALLSNQLNPETALTVLNNAALCPGLEWNISGLGFAHFALIVFILLLIVVWKILTKKQPRNLFF
ncbi:MAG: disulfide bond formation protein B [Amphritea sp.]|nr:disulfide bond formation protein B [Amphritea sp.]